MVENCYWYLSQETWLKRERWICQFEWLLYRQTRFCWQIQMGFSECKTCTVQYLFQMWHISFIKKFRRYVRWFKRHNIPINRAQQTKQYQNVFRFSSENIHNNLEIANQFERNPNKTFENITVLYIHVVYLSTVSIKIIPFLPSKSIILLQMKRC